MSSQPEKIAVLLMAYGSPESVDGLEAYLLDIRGGRETPKALVEEITDRYRQIGGRSPLLDLTRQQAAGLEAELNRRFGGAARCFKTYVGMRHWEPRIQAAVQEILQDQPDRLVGLVMAPHASRMSSGAYFARLEAALQEAQADVPVTQIPAWYDHPGFIEAVAEKAAQAMERFKPEQPFVIFSAHSLPARILAQGDPYDAQLQETTRLLVERLGLAEGGWMFSYQSAGQSAEAWLGPAIETVVQDLAREGKQNLLVVPVGFVCDHVEVLYDIDIHCRDLAAGLGAHLERSDSLNASPRLMQALADLVVDAL